MIALLLFVVVHQVSTAIVMPVNAQMGRGLALGEHLTGSPGFLLINFTLGTQLLNLSSDPTQISGVSHDLSEDDLHRASSPLRWTVAPEPLGDAERKRQWNGDEFRAWTSPERSFGSNLLDAFITVSKLSQGAHLMPAQRPYIGALKTSMVGGQAELLNQKWQLRGGRSVPDKTTSLAVPSSDFRSNPNRDPWMANAQQPDRLRHEATANQQLIPRALGEARTRSNLGSRKVPEGIHPQASPGDMGLRSVRDEIAQGIEFAFVVRGHIKEMDTRFPFALCYITVQDTCGLKWLPSMCYRLGNSNVKFDSPLLLDNPETVVPWCWFPEIHGLQTISRVYLCFSGPQLQDAVEMHGSLARIQNVHPQSVADATEPYGALLSRLDRYSADVTLLYDMELVQVSPPAFFLSLRMLPWYPSDPEDSQEPDEYLYWCCCCEPCVEELFDCSYENQNDGVLDYDNGPGTRHSLWSHPLGLFYSVVLFSFFIIFACALKKLFVVRNRPERPLENRGVRRIRLRGVAIIRYLCWNILGTY